MKTITLVNMLVHEWNHPPTNLIEFSNWVLEQLANIPSEYQETASITFTTYQHDYADPYEKTFPRIVIDYKMPEETDNKRQNEFQQHLVEQQEREMLRLLKEKYE